MVRCLRMDQPATVKKLLRIPKKVNRFDFDRCFGTFQFVQPKAFSRLTGLCLTEVSPTVSWRRLTCPRHHPGLDSDRPPIPSRSTPPSNSSASALPWAMLVAVAVIGKTGTFLVALTCLFLGEISATAFAPAIGDLLFRAPSCGGSVERHEPEVSHHLSRVTPNPSLGRAGGIKW